MRKRVPKNLAKLESPLFDLEERRDLTILRFRKQKKIVGTDLDQIQQLWDFFEHCERKRTKVLLMEVPNGAFAPHIIDDFWRDLGAFSDQQIVKHILWEESMADLHFHRENNAFHRFIDYVMELKTFVMIALTGEIDFNFFELALACDYRIATHNIVLVNRYLERGVPPGSELPWLLARYLGRASAAEILYGAKTLTAKEALDLKLVNRLVSEQTMDNKVVSIAERFANQPREGLLSIKQGIALGSDDLATYWKKQADDFGHSPTTWRSN